MFVRDKQKDTSGRRTFLKRSPSAQQLREEMRKQFKEKLQIGRSKELLRRRELFTGIVTSVQKHFSGVNENELEGSEEIPTTEEMLQMLEEIEREFNESVLQNQADQYCLAMEAETNAIIDNLLNVCTICNKVTEFQTNTSNVICDQCAKLYFDTEHL